MTQDKQSKCKSSSSSSSSSSSKSVVFSNDSSSLVTIRTTLSIQDYNEEEYQACFYHDYDYAQFQKDVDRTLEMISTRQKLDNIVVVNNNNNNNNNSCYCTRGVEGWTKLALSKRSQNIKLGQWVVLKEQERQQQRRRQRQQLRSQKNSFDNDDNDAAIENANNKIAAAYSAVVRQSAVSAFLIGLSDEMSAREDDMYDGQQYQQGQNDHATSTSTASATTTTKSSSCPLSVATAVSITNRVVFPSQEIPMCRTLTSSQNIQMNRNHQHHNNNTNTVQQQHVSATRRPIYNAAA